MLGTDRLRSTALFEKIATPEQAAALIEDGMNVGVGGFTPSFLWLPLRLLPLLSLPPLHTGVLSAVSA